MRALMFGSTLLGVKGALPDDQVQEAQELPAGTDTFVIFIPSFDGGFSVAVRTAVKADRALVTVFYKQGDLLLSMESIAPVSGSSQIYGATRRDFALAIDRVQFVQIEFLSDVTTRETKRR